VVSDDASTDQTADIAGSFLDNRLKLIRQRERLGIGRNWNACIHASRGRYFCLLSSDDILEPTFLAKQIAVLEKYRNAGFVASGCWIINGDGDIVAAEVRKGVRRGSVTVTPGHIALKSYATGPKVILTSVLFRRELVDRLGGFNEQMVICEDWEMYARILGLSDEAYHASILARLRRHGWNTSADQGYALRVLKEHKQVVKIALNTLEESSPIWEMKMLSSKASRALTRRCLFAAARHPQLRRELLDMAFKEDAGLKTQLYTFFIRAGLSPALVAWEDARYRLRHSVKSLLWRLNTRRAKTAG
jgi:glycosyltransferase involved in cell wall biosynthesis